MGVIIVGFYMIILGMSQEFTTSLSIMAIGFAAIIFGAASILSEQRMIPLTKLNFDEKMAMMIGYRGTLEDMKLEMDKENVSDNKIGWKVELVIERCKYDLRAIDHLIPWAKNKEKEELIKFIIDIIEGYRECKKLDETEKYSENICDPIFRTLNLKRY